MRLYGELHRFVPVLAAARGFRVGEIAIHHRPRRFGRSKYGFSRIIKGFLDLLTVKFLTGFGQRPQHLLGTVGLASFAARGRLADLPGRLVGRLADGHRAGAGPSAREGPAVIYSLGLLLLGGQLMSIGFLAELFIAYHAPESRGYSISERTAATATMNDPATNSRNRCRRPACIATVAGETPAPQPIRNCPAPLERVPAVDLRQRSARCSAASSRSIPSTSRPGTHRPFLSANDRSRWCTVRALVEDDMRVAGAPYAIDRVIQQPNWDTIDMVKHDGHLYSSKPPLLPTLMAGVYWPIYRLSGATLGTHPYEIGRAMLVLFNLVPLLVYFVLLASLVERFGTTDWGRMFVMAAAVLRHLLDHLRRGDQQPPAGGGLRGRGRVRGRADLVRRRAAAAVFRRCRAVRRAGGGRTSFPPRRCWRRSALVLLWKAPRPTLLGFVPAVLVVAAAFFGTNWIAHGTPRSRPTCTTAAGTDNWYDYTYERNGRTVRELLERRRRASTAASLRRRSTP